MHWVQNVPSVQPPSPEPVQVVVISPQYAPPDGQHTAYCPAEQAGDWLGQLPQLPEQAPEEKPQPQVPIVMVPFGTL